ncbi:NHL repeat-containing protein [Desulfosporosinus nitroreducens]|uniref:NHL repeat-containing protein n=1 Tax=Desulfosporosinus nitroreducens TaxID=2018668 RepID=A0ABT8QT26_9FIRM|nr:NHL repeat-containing protein [Desulfosporosinus nitroreducens]MDO0824517.1 NHL repeat-containing protein [Desulfosporosinus nitroreducens]
MKLLLILFLLIPLVGCISVKPQNSIPPTPAPSAQAESGTKRSLPDSDSTLKSTDSLSFAKKFDGFSSPTGLAIDASGNLYVSNWSGGNVVKIDAQGKKSTFADGMGSPAGLAFDREGSLYIADYSKDVIYRVTSGKKTVFAQGLHTPTGIVFSKSGDLLVTNRSSNEIVKINPNGQVSTAAKGLQTPVGVVEDADGNLYVTNYSGGISHITPDGTVKTISDEFTTPGVGIAINSQNEVFAVDVGEGKIKRIDKDGKVTNILQGLNSVVGLLIEENGTFYIATWGDGTVHQFNSEKKS